MFTTEPKLQQQDLEKVVGCAPQGLGCCNSVTGSLKHKP